MGNWSYLVYYLQWCTFLPLYFVSNICGLQYMVYVESCQSDFSVAFWNFLKFLMIYVLMSISVFSTLNSSCVTGIFENSGILKGLTNWNFDIWYLLMCRSPPLSFQCFISYFTSGFMQNIVCVPSWLNLTWYIVACRWFFSLCFT